MPIESAIIKQNKLNRKKMPVTEFRSACHEFAQHYVEVQSEGFQRLGAIGDWEHPYLTMNPSFEAEEVKVFGEMYKRGYIYKGLKPVYWCPHDETALAEAEIEYQDDPCTTVYVKFPLHDDLGKLDGYDKSKVSFVTGPPPSGPSPATGHRPAPGGELCPGAEPQRGDLHPGRGPGEKR